MHIYRVGPRKDRRGFDLISAVLPFGRLWYGDPDAITNAVGYAKFYSRSHDAAFRVFRAGCSVKVSFRHLSNGFFIFWRIVFFARVRY
jgi:hypothetical protein